jgi:hypothetical protein
VEEPPSTDRPTNLFWTAGPDNGLKGGFGYISAQ